MLRQTKTTTYLQLQDIFKQSGCPICHMGAQSGRRYLDSLLYESINDPDIRADLSQTMGFCHRHSSDMLNFTGERLAIAILQQDMMREALRRLKNHGSIPKRNMIRKVQAGFQYPSLDGEAVIKVPGPCPACAQQAETEARSMHDLMKFLIDDLDKSLQEAGGLCYPHLLTCLSNCYDEQVFRNLVDMHEQIWAGVRDDLGEYIRKRDYRFSDEAITDSESIAADRSVAILSGERRQRKE